MKVGLHSAAPRPGDVVRNLKTVEDAVRAAAKSGVDMVVFPELYVTGYMVGDDLQRLALHEGDPRLSGLRAACAETKVCAIVGTPRTTRAGVTHNAAALIDEKGALSWYDKRALPTFTTFQEGLWFTPGRTSPVWTNRLGTFGIGICYDLYFPEYQKTQVLAGADVLVNISASPATSRRFFEALLVARAIENACFSLYSNNVGAQDAMVFWGGSRAFGPRGELIGHVDPYQEAQVVVELDMAALRPAREFRPTLRDSGDDAERLAARRPTGPWVK